MADPNRLKQWRCSDVLRCDILSDLLYALLSDSCLANILFDLNTFYFVLLTGTIHFSSLFIHSPDIEKWVAARYRPHNACGNTICTPFRVKGVRDSHL